MKIFNKIFNIIKKREIMIDIKEIKYKKCNQCFGSGVIETCNLGDQTCYKCNGSGKALDYIIAKVI